MNPNWFITPINPLYIVAPTSKSQWKCTFPFPGILYRLWNRFVSIDAKQNSLNIKEKYNSNNNSQYAEVFYNDGQHTALESDDRLYKVGHRAVSRIFFKKTTTSDQFRLWIAHLRWEKEWWEITSWKTRHVAGEQEVSRRFGSEPREAWHI